MKKAAVPIKDCSAVTHIGKWDDIGIISVQEAIRRIRENTDTFFVIHPTFGSNVDLRVAEKGFQEYVRTSPSDTSLDVLLTLPECPS